MAGRIIKRNNLVFEVWSKSYCLREPTNSPMMYSFNDLNDNISANRAIDDFISIMNLGIDMYQSYRF